MSHLFTGSEHAKIYKQFRPQYPHFVTEEIINYCKNHNSDFEVALDLGCGSGQNTPSLAPYFSTVIGTDVSEAQIREAQSNASAPDNVKFKVSAAEDLSFLDDRSVDLITVATAFHWMETKQVYKEALRLLKPGGVMAIYTLGVIAMDHEPSNDIIKQFYSTLDTEGCWDAKAKHVQSNYANLPPMPFHDIYRYDDVFVTKMIKLKDVTGHMISWSAYQTYIRKFPESTLAKDTACSLRNLHGNDDTEVAVKWPFFFRIGHTCY